MSKAKITKNAPVLSNTVLAECISDSDKWKEIFTTVIQHAIFEQMHVDETIKFYMSKYKLVEIDAKCEHPWAFVIGDGEIKPAKCLKCGEYLSS